MSKKNGIIKFLLISMLGLFVFIGITSTHVNASKNIPRITKKSVFSGYWQFGKAHKVTVKKPLKVYRIKYKPNECIADSRANLKYGYKVLKPGTKITIDICDVGFEVPTAKGLSHKNNSDWILRTTQPQKYLRKR